MEKTNETFILTTLDALFAVLDMRVNCRVYKLDEHGDFELIKEGSVYEIVTDTDFYTEHRANNVGGISICLGTISVQI
ncbi:MAG: hypothetical protein J6V44_08715 [Methanobrevibacter sp.]|nr:hypothetical protein [Methanobrevibacter sp.]